MFVINGERFKTKTALKNRILEIRDRYNDGVHLVGLDYEFMRSVLDLHESADIKIGPGVKSIFVNRNPIHKKNRCFYLERVDGTVTDFSFNRCMTPESKESKVKNAFRFAVADDVVRFKAEFFAANGGRSACPVTGEEITPDNSHVDHAPPSTFLALINRFCSEYGFTLGEIETVSADDGMIGNRFADPRFEEAFKKFHTENARLRVVSPKANLSDIKIHPCWEVAVEELP